MRVLSLSLFFAAILASQPCASENPANDPNQAKREVAAGIEWVAANCNANEIPALPVMLATAIINGSSLEQMSAARQAAHHHIQQSFASVADACAASIARLKAQ